MLITFNQLKDKKGIHYTRDHVRRMCKAGKFPRPLKLGGGKRVAWLEAEIDAYIAACAAQRAA